MPKMICRQCGFKTSLSAKAAEIGMLCPECQCQKLRAVRPRDQRMAKVSMFRPNTIRSLVGGVILIVLGIAMFAWGMSMWNVGRMGARVVGAGIVLGIGGCVSLIAGLVGLARDSSSSD